MPCVGREKSLGVWPFTASLSSRSRAEKIGSNVGHTLPELAANALRSPVICELTEQRFHLLILISELRA